MRISPYGSTLSTIHFRGIILLITLLLLHKPYALKFQNPAFCLFRVLFCTIIIIKSNYFSPKRIQRIIFIAGTVCGLNEEGTRARFNKARIFSVQQQMLCFWLNSPCCSACFSCGPPRFNFKRFRLNAALSTLSKVRHNPNFNEIKTSVQMLNFLPHLDTQTVTSHHAASTSKRCNLPAAYCHLKGPESIT
jgi:hypothetical protein